MNDKVQERINQIGGPSYDIPPINTAEKKFNGRNRLYIGNIGNEVTEEDLTELFKPYGETSEIFLNKEKNFAFIKLDFHCNAEKAKSELDGTVLKSRNLKIRFAPNSTSIKIKNLTPQVSNELLHYAFAPFGEVSLCYVYFTNIIMYTLNQLFYIKYICSRSKERWCASTNAANRQVKA